VPLFLITAGVTWAFNNPGLYQRGFEKYDVSRVTGITTADLDQVSADIRGYFNSGQGPLEVRTRVFGQERELFNPREITHMQDVKGLLQWVYLAAAVTAFYMLAAAGLVMFRHRRRGVGLLARRFLWGGGLTLAIAAAVGLFALVGFDTLFLKFHQISFANDYWQLDRRNDFLVMLFPENFWFDATMWVAIRTVAGALIILTVSAGYLRWWPQSKLDASVAPVEEAT